MATRVVVVGARGRIGAAAGASLAGRGYEVLGLARNPGPSGSFPVRELALDDPARLAEDLDGADVVVYCAGAHHGAVETIHELAVFEVNAVAPVRVALAAAHAGATRFVYLSSTAVLDAEDRSPAGAYVRSKRLAELLLPPAFPGALTLLRLGWVIDPTDEVAYRHLWPESGAQVIVGGLPVPMVALADVAAAIELLCRPELAGRADLAGQVDLVGGCPTQSALYEVVSGLATEPLWVVDARTPARVARLAAARRTARESPTWLTTAVPGRTTDWASLGLDLGSWRDSVAALWEANAR